LIAVLGFSRGNVLFVLGQLYVIVLVVRAILSFFPMTASSPFAPVARAAYVLTEPVLRPFRRVIPPVGMFDLSFLVAFIVIELIVYEVLRRL
jgi:YggT family protein